MSRILLFVDESSPEPHVLNSLQAETGSSPWEIREALDHQTALVDVELCDSHDDAHASQLRSVTACLEELSLSYRIFELPDGESIIDGLQPISVEDLANILDEADEELRRQSEE